MILRTALVPVAFGIIAGSVASWLGSRWIEHQLFGVSAHDPATFGAAVAALVGSAILAALIPARRATGIDPIRALRVE